MKKHVFGKMNSHPAVKQYKNDIGLDPKYDQHLKTYFDTAVRQNRYYCEDWTFCENWRDLGGQVWVDKRVLLKHTGTYVFDFQTQDQLYRDLHNLALQNGAALPGAGGVAAPVDVPSVPPAKVLASSKKKKSKNNLKL